MTLIDTEKPHTLDANGNPTPAALREVAGALAAMHKDGVEFDMRSIDWSAEKPCGTPVCHAGAFAVAAGIRRENRGDDYHRWYYGYLEPAAALARHLGFEDDHDYCVWATENPGVWGSNLGGEMFRHEDAFPDAPKRTLQTIADHYCGMADRLELKTGRR